MPLTRQQKEARVKDTVQDMTDATSMVFMAYQALPVDQAEELRDQLFAEGAALRILPKRLLRLVLQELKIEFDPMAQDGQLAVIWGKDAVSPAKIIHTFAKKHENVQLIAGSLEGKILSLPEVQALAQLPSRQQLLGQFVGTLAGPIRGLQTVLNGVQRQTVYVLQAIADKKSPAGDPLK